MNGHGYIIVVIIIIIIIIVIMIIIIIIVPTGIYSTSWGEGTRMRTGLSCCDDGD